MEWDTLAVLHAITTAPHLTGGSGEGEALLGEFIALCEDLTPGRVVHYNHVEAALLMLRRRRKIGGYVARIACLFRADGFAGTRPYWTEILLNALTQELACAEAVGIGEGMEDSLIEDLSGDGWTNLIIESLFATEVVNLDTSTTVACLHPRLEVIAGNQLP